MATRTFLTLTISTLFILILVFLANTRRQEYFDLYTQRPFCNGVAGQLYLICGGQNGQRR